MAGGLAARACRVAAALLLVAVAAAEAAPTRPNPTALAQAEASFYRQQHSDAYGTVRADGLIKAIEQRKAMLAQQQLAAQQSTVLGLAPKPAAGIAATGWLALGPGNIGGRIRAILSDPSTGKLFVGAVDGGIWVSGDRGQTWAPVDDFMGSLSVSALAEDPNGVLYAGTGEGFHNIDGIQGSGVFVSTDHGVTWNPLPSTDPASDPDWHYVNDIAINSSGVILAATGGGASATSNYKGGVYESTDGGSSWTKVHTGRSFSVAWDPNNPSKAIFDAAADSGGPSVVYYTTDGGSTWTQATIDSNSAPAPHGHSVLAYAGSASGTIYASVDQSGGEVFKSTDGGKTWNLETVPAELYGQGGYLGAQGWYANAIWVDPTDSNHIIVGGLDLFQSTDGGASWTQISDWTNTPTSPHADHHSIVADSGFNGSSDTTVFIGTDGGLYAAADPSKATTTSGWTELNNGLAITQFYGGAGRAGETASANGNIVPIIGGAQDNGTLLYSGNVNGWTMVYGGDGGACAIDPADGNYLYGEFTFLAVVRSTNGGKSATDIATSIGDAGTYANFIAPFVLDPNDTSGNTMYAGGAYLWLSTNVKASPPTFSSMVSNGLPNDRTFGNYISAITVTQGNANEIWVGYDDGSVYRQTGTVAAPVWTQMGVGPLPGRMVQSILVMPNPTPSAETVYVTYGGYTSDNIWRGSYDGTSWTWTSLTPASSGFPQVPVYSLAVNPANANWLYAGTDVGVFTSTDGGAAWSTSNDGPANVRVNQLLWFDSSPSAPVLLAVTHGRGMFKTSVNNAAPSISNLSPASAAAGSGGFTLTVNGSNFVNGVSTVQWNGSALATTYVSATRLTAAVSAADVATAGTASVTVANGSNVSGAASFTIKGPTIAGLSPTGIAAGSGGFTLTVNGSNFVSGVSTVQWNGSALATTYVSTTRLTAAVSAANVATAGAASVTVANGSSVSAASSFTVDTPAITSLSPGSIVAGSSGFTLTVNGSNFVSGVSTVQWNGSPLITTYVTATRLTAAVSAADVAAPGTASVTVLNGANASTAASFTIGAAATGSGGGGAIDPALLLLLAVSGLLRRRIGRRSPCDPAVGE